MIEMGPCQPPSMAMHAFIVVMNVVQTVALAFVAQRAARKNREDKASNGKGSE